VRQSVPLRSSMLPGASYDDETNQLTVEFKNGREYTHDNVPGDIFAGLVAAPSPGRYYLDNIKSKF
jgi:KTSC domain